MNAEPLLVGLAQMEVIPGKPSVNTKKIVETIREQRSCGTHLLAFPEMCISGYMIGDKWGSDSLVRDFHKWNDDVVEASDGIAVMWGNVDIDPSKVNRNGTMRKYNASFTAQDGVLLNDHTVYKTNMATYGPFHDYRHFASLADLAEEMGVTLESLIKPHELELAGTRFMIGKILCEDMWWKDYGMHRNIAAILARKRAQYILNHSCSPSGFRKNDKRHRVVNELFEDGYGVPFGYANNVGDQDVGKSVMGYDGGTTQYDRNGQILHEAEPFADTVLNFPLSLDALSNGEREHPEIPPIQEIKRALVHSMRAFCKRNGIEKKVDGLSGGIDSAVGAALWAEVLGPENVFAVNMPSEYNDDELKDAAAQTAENLGINYAVIPIQDRYELSLETMSDVVFNGPNGEIHVRVEPGSTGDESIQARDRGDKLMSISAGIPNSAVSCNGNKVELAFGWASLYGDLIGALSHAGDLNKNQIYALARECNRERAEQGLPGIVEESFTVVPKPELKNDQEDPFWYPYHDQLVHMFVVELKQPEDVLRMYKNNEIEATTRNFLPEEYVTDEYVKDGNGNFTLRPGIIREYFGSDEAFIEDLERCWRMFHRGGVFKRYQGPPIIKVTPRCFGYDFHESQLPEDYTLGYFDLYEEILGKRHPDDVRSVTRASSP